MELILKETGDAVMRARPRDAAGGLGRARASVPEGFQAPVPKHFRFREDS